jgi:membrane protease YdiL (CAAX protease family)
LVLTLALSAPVYYLIAEKGGLRGGAGIYVLLIMWCPGVSGLLTQLFFRKSLRGMGWGWGKSKYQIAAYLIPLAYTAVVYLTIWTTGLVPVKQEFAEQLKTKFGMSDAAPATALGLYLLLTISVGSVINSFAALGEEIGWRGLLVPELAKLGTFPTTALLSGLIWAAWHYPLILWGGYAPAGLPVWYALCCFTVLVVAISFPMAWLRLKSGSLWTGVFFHASHNLFVQAIFTPLSSETEISKFVIDEFGLGLALVSVVVAYYFWRRRGELTEDKPPASSD